MTTGSASCPSGATTRDKLRRKFAIQQMLNTIKPHLKPIEEKELSEIVNSKLEKFDEFEMDGMNTRPLPVSILDLFYDIMKRYSEIDSIEIKLKDERSMNLKLE